MKATTTIHGSSSICSGTDCIRTSKSSLNEARHTIWWCREERRRGGEDDRSTWWCWKTHDSKKYEIQIPLNNTNFHVIRLLSDDVHTHFQDHKNYRVDDLGRTPWSWWAQKRKKKTKLPAGWQKSSMSFSLPINERNTSTTKPNKNKNVCWNSNWLWKFSINSHRWKYMTFSLTTRYEHHSIHDERAIYNQPKFCCEMYFEKLTEMMSLLEKDEVLDSQSSGPFSLVHIWLSEKLV